MKTQKTPNKKTTTTTKHLKIKQKSGIAFRDQGMPSVGFQPDGLRQKVHNGG